MWFNKYTIEQINSACKNTLLEHLDIKFEKIGEDFICFNAC